MTLRERIVELLAAQPKAAFCEVCLQKRLGMDTPFGINRTTLLLAYLGYKRGTGKCTECGELRKVLQYVAGVGG